jgi:hypothetical protein
VRRWPRSSRPRTPPPAHPQPPTPRPALSNAPPGFVPLLLELSAQEADEGRRAELLQRARRACDAVWQRGLLTKGVGLCHGIGGNAYAFLALARTTGEAAALARAQRFALHAARNWRQLFDVPDRPASLYEGLSGAVCVLMDALLAPSGGGMPGYDDL